MNASFLILVGRGGRSSSAIVPVKSGHGHGVPWIFDRALLVGTTVPYFTITGKGELTRTMVLKDHHFVVSTANTGRRGLLLQDVEKGTERGTGSGALVLPDVPGDLRVPTDVVNR